MRRPRYDRGPRRRRTQYQNQRVAAADLQPVFAAEGPQNTGKTLASLTALQELGLIEEQEGRWLPVPVTAKQDLASAPVLQKLAELAKQA